MSWFIILATYAYNKGESCSIAFSSIKQVHWHLNYSMVINLTISQIWNNNSNAIITTVTVRFVIRGRSQLPLASSSNPNFAENGRRRRRRRAACVCSRRKGTFKTMGFDPNLVWSVNVLIPIRISQETNDILNLVTITLSTFESRNFKLSVLMQQSHTNLYSNKITGRRRLRFERSLKDLNLVGFWVSVRKRIRPTWANVCQIMAAARQSLNPSPVFDALLNQNFPSLETWDLLGWGEQLLIILSLPPTSMDFGFSTLSWDLDARS